VHDRPSPAPDESGNGRDQRYRPGTPVFASTDEQIGVVDGYDPAADLLTVRPTDHRHGKEMTVPLDAIAREDDRGIYLANVSEDFRGFAHKGSI
jgi:hypothetical protein